MLYFLTNFKNYISYIIAAFIGYFFYKYYIYPLYISPLCRIPGPPVERLFFGNLISFFKSDPDIYLARLKEQYGDVVLFRSFFNSPEVVITDHKLIQHILVNNTYDYVRAIADRPEARDMLGKSIFVVEGNVHKRQRKIMNPAFSFTHIKGVFPTVVKIVNKLKDNWMNQIGDKNEGTITVTTMLPKIALDIIGLVGFGYEFNSTTTESELARAYETITSEKQTPSYFMLIIATIFFPFISKLPFGRNIRFQKSLKVIKACSNKIVFERKNKLIQGGQDLLSILVRINDELPEGENLTHEELKSQVMSFLIAGHETTSTASTWALYLLAKHPDIQNRLREELIEAFPDRSYQPTFDEIECLKYLDSVIKEALRVIPPGK
ncbi:cytochrome P450 [Gigaspora rosea]|uniref:Cytochrome P450 n=1 Tax=Gigaspora rosea TaxID=44941 RepID=A0A397UN43_9GLOM|nr:cytochrome P450 [Gigaspora rosea]